MKKEKLEELAEDKTLAHKVFRFLDKEGFTVVTWDADWKKFDYDPQYDYDTTEKYNINMVVEEVNPSGDGYQVVIGPRSMATGYEWKPNMFSRLKTHPNQYGLFVMSKGDYGKMLISDPPVKEIMINYLAKDVREKQKVKR